VLGPLNVEGVNFLHAGVAEQEERIVGSQAGPLAESSPSHASGEICVSRVLEGRAIEIFHGDKSFFVLVADVMDSANVGMIQSGSRLGLTFESF